MDKNWSKYQQNIFSFIADENGNAVIEAVAGSGKTTTIVEAMKMVRGSTIFLAFNKSIADELKARGVNARTFHSLTYNPVCRHRNVKQVEANKMRRLVDLHLTDDEHQMYGTFCQRLVGIAKQLGVGTTPHALIQDSPDVWADIIEHHGFELEEERADLGRAIDLASELLKWSNESNMIDFDDMLYLPIVENLTLPKFDFVFVDEAQDTNSIQRALLTKIMRPAARIIAVGDPAQAIYGFRGADSNSLDLIAQQFKCKRLPLSVSYRCPTSVVTLARTWVSHIEAAPGAPEGAVHRMGFQWKPDVFNVGDLVVCRTTRPVISLAYRLLKAHIPVRIMGKEIGQGLKSLITKMRASDLDTLQVKLEAYTQREVDKATARMQDAKAEAIQDKTDAIMFLVEGLTEDRRTVQALLAVIDTLFQEAGTSVVLATIHKAKGLEADRVFWLNASQCPPRWVRGGWQLKQEENLCYVAVTRAKKELFMIEEEEV